MGEGPGAPTGKEAQPDGVAGLADGAATGPVLGRNGISLQSGAMLIHTDSTYVMKGMTEWMDNWKRRGWKTANRKPVKNVDLWQRLDEAMARHDVEWRWVRGHSGVPENERADELARLAIPDIRCANSGMT